MQPLESPLSDFGAVAERISKVEGIRVAVPIVVYCHKDYLDFPVPSEDVNFDSVAGLQAIVDQWTSLYAATSEKHDT